MGGNVRLPIAHDLRCDATLQRQAVASYNFLFRKEMLPCEHVKWRKRKMSGRALLVVIIGVGGIGDWRPLDALVVLEQARMCVLEVDERGCHPGGVVVEALILTEPVAQVCALRHPSNERACP